MQALMMTKYGDIGSSLAFQNNASPKASPSQVVIKVHASSINPFDYKVLKGEFKALKNTIFTRHWP